MNTKCQIFTPENYVEELLNSVDYKKDLFGKKFLENSCGDGNILSAAVKRYIKDCKSKKMSYDVINRGLCEDIYGVEIDPIHYFSCLQNLNIIVKNEGLNKVSWKIYNDDYLTIKLNEKFDYIVGNPPYITYQELTLEQRKFVKSNFATCAQGKYDYCYAFIEKSISNLKKDGNLSYLIPSSIFKTVFGSNLRALMIQHIIEIKDYTLNNIFNNALVKSSIVVFQKNSINRYLDYKDMSSNTCTKIKLTSLKDKWVFDNKCNNGNHKFGDYFQVSHAVATLSNNVFVIKNWEERHNSFVVDNYELEKSIIKKAATPRTLKYGKSELIIFPYNYNESKLVKYSDKEFEEGFPNIANYLNLYRTTLDRRKKDKSAKWFEYGRSQALLNLNQQKLLMSTVISGEINIHLLDEECIPYSGMYIVPKTSLYDLNDAIELLEGEEFHDYVQSVGIRINGRSLRITSKDIMNFKF